MKRNLHPRRRANDFTSRRNYETRSHEDGSSWRFRLGSFAASGDENIDNGPFGEAQLRSAAWGRVCCYCRGSSNIQKPMSWAHVTAARIVKAVHGFNPKCCTVGPIPSKVLSGIYVLICLASLVLHQSHRQRIFISIAGVVVETITCLYSCALRAAVAPHQNDLAANSQFTRISDHWSGNLIVLTTKEPHHAS